MAVSRTLGVIGAASSIATLAYLLSEDEKKALEKKAPERLPGYIVHSSGDAIYLKNDVELLKDSINKLPFQLPSWLVEEVESLAAEAQRLYRLSIASGDPLGGLGRLQAAYDRYYCIRKVLRSEFQVGDERGSGDVRYTGPTSGPIFIRYVEEKVTRDPEIKSRRGLAITGLVLAVLAGIAGVVALGVLAGTGVISILLGVGVSIAIILSLVILSNIVVHKLLPTEETLLRRVRVDPKDVGEPYGWRKALSA
ncbi:hypothetical protein [Chlamydiifrater phoenicopteri]|uniref:hypothetical protein n=1 Tax=Chlamydiifrater phoenicopteri TaxID=2681469 RepID=UPI001BCB0B9A|nr:hypothetical protein [Chlamydiifrater phoenicopteri]